MEGIGRFLLALLTCVGCGFCQVAYCQPPPPELPTRHDTASGSNGSSSEKLGTADVVYVPFAHLTEVFQKPDASVVLPYDTYQKLLDAWRSSHLSREAPAAVITRADYDIRVHEESARITAKLDVVVPEKEWAEVIVRFGSAAIGSVKSEKQVLLRGNGPGEYALMFPKPGNYHVELNLAAMVHQSPEGKELKLTCPPVAQTSVEVSVPQADQTIKIDPQVVTTTADDAPPDVTRVRADIGASDHIGIRWRPAASMQPQMNLLASVENRQLVTIGDGMVHVDAWLSYDILRGEMTEARLELPKSYRLLDLNADSRIRSWKSSEGEKSQVVTIELLNPATKQLQLELHAETRQENGNVTFGGQVSEGGGGVQALDVVRQSGQIAVRHSPDLAVAVSDQQSLVRMVAGDVDAHLRGENAFAFKFYTWSFRLQLQVKEVTPRISVAQQVQFLLREEELQFKNALRYQVERAGIFELALKVPQGAVIDDVQSPQMKEFAVDAAQGRLNISLLERTQGSVEITVKGHQPLGDERAGSLLLPILEPLNVERETGTVLVFTGESIEVQSQEQGLQGAQPLPVSKSLRMDGGTLGSAWSYTRRPLAIPIRTLRKPTRINAREGTVIDVQPELTQVKTQLVYEIEYAAVDTFRFDVPEEVSGRLQIEIPGDAGASAPIKQKTASPPANGRVIWTVVTQREVLGQQRFDLSYPLPAAAPADATGAAKRAQFQLQLVRPLGLVDGSGTVTAPVSSLRGEVLLKKDRTLSLIASATGGGIEQIDLRELTLLPQEGALAFHYFRDDAQDPVVINVTREQFEIQELISTVISRGLVEVVVGEDEEANYRCRFLLKSSQRQRLFIAMPVGLELLGAFLNDREIKIEKADEKQLGTLGKDWAAFWVNVARSESSDVPFRLSFQFLWRINPTLGESRFGQGNLRLPLPILGEGQPVPIQELQVVLWVPEKYALVGDAPPFSIRTTGRENNWWTATATDHHVASLQTWIGSEESSPRSASQFPTQDRVPYIYSTLGSANSIEVRWWKILPTTLLFSVAVALIAWILLGTRWENKLGFLLLLLFGAFFYGLSDSQAMFQAFRAAAPGLIFLAALWILHGIFAWVRALRLEKQRHYVTTDVPYAVIPPPGVFEPAQPEPTEAHP